MDTKIFEEYESEVRSYCRSFPTLFDKAKGSIMTDADGKRYIDFFCGAGSLNYGHNNDYIKDRLIEYLQGDGIVHAMDMMTIAKGEFLNYFENSILKPRNLEYKVMFPAPTGTNAIESALKLARKVKGRRTIWGLMGAFHGMTAGSLAITTEKAARNAAGIPLDNVVHIPAPYMMGGFDTISYMRMLINDDHSGIEKPAALIIETVQAEGGIWVFDAEWLRDVERFCHENDILLIIDDIQVGCARTGTFFSFERAGIKPDIFVMSKSIGGYGLPFALVMFKPELDIWKPGEHNGTFRGNQLSMVAAKAGLEYMLNNHIEDEVRRKGEIISKYLNEHIQNKNYAIRGIGCIWGIDVKTGAMSRKITANCFENGVIAERAGRDDSVVKIMPALNIPDELLYEGLEIVCKCVNEA